MISATAALPHWGCRCRLYQPPCFLSRGTLELQPEGHQWCHPGRYPAHTPHCHNKIQSTDRNMLVQLTAARWSPCFNLWQKRFLLLPATTNKQIKATGGRGETHEESFTCSPLRACTMLTSPSSLSSNRMTLPLCLNRGAPATYSLLQSPTITDDTV